MRRLSQQLHANSPTPKPSVSPRLSSSNIREIQYGSTSSCADSCLVWCAVLTVKRRKSAKDVLDDKSDDDSEEDEEGDAGTVRVLCVTMC